MSVSSINNTPNYISLSSRAERIATIDNRIATNNRQIASLENQITAQQEVSTTLKEMMVNNTDSINIIKEMISNNEKQIAAQQQVSGIIRETISNNEKQIANNIDNINITREMIANNVSIIDLTKQRISNNEKSIEFLQETQVLAKESKQSWIDYKNILQKKYDLNIALINHLEEDKAIDLKIIDCYEKILAIVMKNPSKYEGMSLKDFSEVSEVANTKNDLNEIVEIKVKDYPQEHRNDLINVASKVIAHSLEKKSLVDLEQKIDLALNKEVLAKIDKFDKSPVSIYRTNQYFYNEHYFTNIKKYSF